jgi:hypothetical protein
MEAPVLTNRYLAHPIQTLFRDEAEMAIVLLRSRVASKSYVLPTPAVWFPAGALQSEAASHCLGEWSLFTVVSNFFLPVFILSNANVS